MKGEGPIALISSVKLVKERESFSLSAVPIYSILILPSPIPTNFNIILQHIHAFCRQIITLLVMAFSQVTGCDNYAVSALLECFQYEMGRNPPAAHGPEHEYIRRILQPQ